MMSFPLQFAYLNGGSPRNLEFCETSVLSLTCGFVGVRKQRLIDDRAAFSELKFRSNLDVFTYKSLAIDLEPERK